MHSEPENKAVVPILRYLRSLGGRVRQRYFRNLIDTAISTICIVLGSLLILNVFQWAVVDSVWQANSAAECSERGSGACWAVIPARINLILFGVYPFAEHWRAAVGCIVLLVACILSCTPYFWQVARFVTLWILSFSVFLGLMRGGIFGLPLISTEQWGGLALTFFVFASIMIMGMPLAILLALTRYSGPRWARFAVGVCIDLVRSVPLVAILFGSSLIVPLLFPGWLSGDKLSRVILGFSFFIACYQAEILRGGFQAVEPGQEEAAKALGMRYWQYHLTVILPQVFRISLPQTVNQVVTGFKDTSYVAIVGFFDLVASGSAALGTGDWAIAFVEVYIVVGLLYFVFGYSLSIYGMYVERQINTAYQR
jgi:general L-amino acid transport system permease protein